MSLSKIMRPRNHTLPVRELAFDWEPRMHAGRGTSELPVEEDPVDGLTLQLVQLDTAIAGRREELRVLEERALQLVQEAEEKAMDALRHAEEQTTAWRRDAQTQGYESGLVEGRAKAAEETEDTLAKARSVLLLAEQERHHRIHGAEEFLIALSLIIARRVVEREVTIDDDIVRHWVRDLLADVDKAHRVEVRVSASDFGFVLQERSQFESVLLQQADCLVTADSSLSPGDVVIATEFGTVDGRLDVRFEQVRQILTDTAKEWDQIESVHA